MDRDDHDALAGGMKAVSDLRISLVVGQDGVGYRSVGIVVEIVLWVRLVRRNQSRSRLSFHIIGDILFLDNRSQGV